MKTFCVALKCHYIQTAITVKKKERKKNKQTILAQQMTYLICVNVTAV